MSTRSSDNPVRPRNSVAESVHKAFALLLPLLAGVLAVDMRATSRTPFDTHPGTMWTFIVSVIIYCCALSLSTYLQSPLSHQPYWLLEKLSLYAAIAFGSLAAVCLLSPLLPVLVDRLVFVLWALIVSISIGFQHRTLLISKAKKIWNRIRGNPPGLPISRHDTTTAPANSTSGGNPATLPLYHSGPHDTKTAPEISTSEGNPLQLRTPPKTLPSPDPMIQQQHRPTQQADETHCSYSTTPDLMIQQQHR